MYVLPPFDSGQLDGAEIQRCLQAVLNTVFHHQGIKVSIRCFLTNNKFHGSYLIYSKSMKHWKNRYQLSPLAIISSDFRVYSGRDRSARDFFLRFRFQQVCASIAVFVQKGGLFSPVENGTGMGLCHKRV
jgi:hypothetical protein